MIYLDPKLVIKHFGTRPWLGRRIPVTVMRHTGIVWRQFSKKYVPKPHEVQVVIALVPIRGKQGFWELKVDPQYETEAMRWLDQAFNPPKPPPRGAYNKVRGAAAGKWQRSAIRSAKRGAT